MQISGARAGKTRGRLGRDVLARLGKTIEDYFDDVIAAGVPERFRILLEQIDGPQDSGRHSGRLGAELAPQNKGQG
jgi:hypothetical protein